MNIQCDALLIDEQTTEVQCSMPSFLVTVVTDMCSFFNSELWLRCQNKIFSFNKHSKRTIECKFLAFCFCVCVCAKIELRLSQLEGQLSAIHGNFLSVVLDFSNNPMQMGYFFPNLRSFQYIHNVASSQPYLFQLTQKTSRVSWQKQHLMVDLTELILHIKTTDSIFSSPTFSILLLIEYFVTLVSTFYSLCDLQ